MASVEETATVPMSVKLTNKFYEPVIFLKALNIEMATTAQYTSPETEVSNDPKALLKVFVYKLALVCDSEKGNEGRTITSFAVLRMAQTQRVKYWFASNQRTDDQLSQTAVFVKSLLEEIGMVPRRTLLQHDEYISSLLRKVLLFNKHRVRCYLQELRSEAHKCLRNCFSWDEQKSLAMRACLEDIVRASSSALDSKPSASDEIMSYEAAIKTLQNLLRSPSWQSLSTIAREVRLEPEETLNCWPEMRHMVNRILAYPDAIDFLIAARTLWPQLFQNPEVVYSTSSKPMSPRPGRNKSYDAASIVGRMTRKEKEINIFRNLVAELQLFSLDERIRNQFEKDTFHPVVHSEVNLLHTLAGKGLLGPEKFFEGVPYIGSSKPPCRLCEYYFQEHKSGVGLRKGHKNLYTSWRVPDVLQTEGEAGEERRQVMIDRILVRVRKDAFNLIRKRVRPVHRDHDSATSSARLTHLQQWATHVASEDLASTMVHMQIDDEEEGGVRL